MFGFSIARPNVYRSTESKHENRMEVAPTCGDSDGGGRVARRAHHSQIEKAHIAVKQLWRVLAGMRYRHQTPGAVAALAHFQTVEPFPLTTGRGRHCRRNAPVRQAQPQPCRVAGAENIRGWASGVPDAGFSRVTAVQGLLSTGRQRTLTAMSHWQLCMCIDIELPSLRTSGTSTPIIKQA